MMDEDIEDIMNVRVKLLTNISITQISNFINNGQILFNDEYSSIFLKCVLAVKLKLDNVTIIKLFSHDKLYYVYSIVVVYDDHDVLFPESDIINEEIIFYTLPNLLFNLKEIFKENTFNCFYKAIREINVNDPLKMSNLNISQVKFANKILISCIYNPNYDSSIIYDDILKKFFNKPRLLTVNGVFQVYSKDDPLYWNNISHFSCPQYPLIYFKVNSIEPDSTNSPYLIHNNYTTLIQESSINSFIPSCVSQIYEDLNFDFLEYLHCFGEIAKNMHQYISPFLHSKQDIKKLMTRIIPVFLLTGPVSSGKSKLCQIIAISLNIPHITLNCNLLIGETVIALELNLDRTFKIVCSSAPCMLILENFEMMGKNKDGEIDSHIAFSFKEFIYRLMRNCDDKKIIVIATSTNHRAVSIYEIFLQLWHIQAPLEEERCMMFKCILKSYNIDSVVLLTDLVKNSGGMYYDDLQRLVENASQISFKRNHKIIFIV